MSRKTGKVKWFNDAKGFGFIISDNANGDIFVHHSAINMAGRRTLHDGDRVEFDVVQSAKGPQASDVVVV